MVTTSDGILIGGRLQSDAARHMDNFRATERAAGAHRSYHLIGLGSLDRIDLRRSVEMQGANRACARQARAARPR